MIAKFIIDDVYANPAINMAFDEMLFEKVQNSENSQIFLRFYKWSKEFCSFGYSQRIENKPKFKEKYKNRLVRRPTGGGFVYHGRDVCITVISSINFHEKFASINKSYSFLHSMILKGLQSQNSGISLFEEKERLSGNYACFERPVKADIMLGSKKIMGSAQKRKGDVLFQQGSIAMEDIEEKAIVKSFEKELGFKFEQYEYSDKDLDAAETLLENKYVKDGWNFRI